MFEIRKQFEFCAAHQLKGLPPEHQCGRLHGHNYVVEIVLRAPSANIHGFVVDYGDLSPLKEMLDAGFDHRNLNDVMEQPTAENLAALIHKWAIARWPETYAIRVSETPKTWAEYCPRPDLADLRNALIRINATLSEIEPAPSPTYVVSGGVID